MKKHLLLVVILYLITCYNSFGSASTEIKGSISGVITDEKTGKPIQGASIYIADIKTGSSSDANGKFIITNLSEGVHLIEVSHVGYTTIAATVDISGDVTRDFKLTEAIIENSTVIITGVTKAAQLKKVPFQVAVIKKDELLQNAGTNLIDNISRKPGIASVATGPAISKPVIRGLGYNRVLTINDGIRQEGQQWGDEHGIEIDEASVNKIEVLKGPASLVYGSDAMAGVINIITNVPVQNNTIKINAGSNYQSNNRLTSINGNVAGNINGFNWNMYGTVKEAADYRNRYDGYVFNSKFNEHNAGGYLGYNGGWGYSHLLISNFNLKTGLTEGERDDEGYFVKDIAGGSQVRATEDDFKSTKPEIPYQHIRHFKIGTDNNFRIGKNNLGINVAWQRNQRQEFGNPDDIREAALYFDLKTITYTAQFHLKEKNGWKNSIGINGMNQQNNNRGIEQLIPDYSLQDLGGFIFSQKEIKKLTLSGGIRFDNRNVSVQHLLDAGTIKGDAFSKSFSNVSGSIGGTYAISNTINLKLNIARAFRAPGISELASNGAHEGTIRYEYGDQQLRSETSTQTDFAIEYGNKHFSLNAAAYYNYFNNFIFYRKLLNNNGTDSLVAVDGQQLTAFKFDQEKAHLAGVEVSLDIHPHPLDWLHFQNSFSYVAGRLQTAIEGTKNLPFIPAPKLLTELKADFKKVGKNFSNCYIKFEVENNFRQNKVFTAFNTETATAAYSLMNAGIGTTVINKRGVELFSLNLSVNNIADIAYQNHLSRLKYAAENLATGRTGVYNMGRNVSLRLNVPLSFSIQQ
ncbi:MAG: TonB-dependent receptor [Bacteroidetes bacterium]|nr:TonB-dependent receptor [Bacteroidota bacterium]